MLIEQNINYAYHGRCNKYADYYADEIRFAYLINKSTEEKTIFTE